MVLGNICSLVDSTNNALRKIKHDGISFLLGETVKIQLTAAYNQIYSLIFGLHCADFTS